MSAQSVTWSVDQYAKFLNERTRPAIELLARVNLSTVATAVDLGCGPGNSTVILKHRWPDAHVTGVDNSEEMLTPARKEHTNIEFLLHDISTWKCDEPVDLIFSNAAYQWVPEHKTLLPRLTSHVKPGGVIAMQMPHNHEFPTHIYMREVAAENTWSVDLKAVRNEPPVLDPQTYYDVLSPSCSEIDIWETKYFHVMDSIDAVVDWLKGTGLRPFLAKLKDDEQKKYLQLYAEKLSGFIPTQVDGKVLLPFPRLFIVARKKG